MSGAGGALLPIFLLIGLGYALKRLAFDDDRVWRGLDTLASYVLLPALLLRGLAGANLTEVPLGRAVLVAAGAILATTAVLHLARASLRLTKTGFTSVVQGGVRPNAYIALAAILALYADDGLSSAALGIAAFIPLANGIAVHVLTRHAKGGGGRVLLRQVLLDPLILACIAGVLVNLADSGMPAWLDTVLEQLGRAALPLGLLVVGASLAFGGLRRGFGAILLAGLAKLALLPGLVWAGLRLAGIGGADAGALILFAAAPASISTYILARRMGGDHRLMAGIIAVQTLASAALVPLWIGLALAV